MANELITQADATFLSKGIPSEHEMMVFSTMAKKAAESKLYGNFGNEATIMMTMLAARELGVPPMMALNGGIQNIKGKIEISARLMNALMRRAGISINVKESSDEKCVIEAKRSDTGDSVVASYTIQDAKKADLIKMGGGWTKNPKDMLFARAISRVGRQLAPDVIGGCYVEGEIRAIEAQIVEDEPEKRFEDLSALYPPEEHEKLQEFINLVGEKFSWNESRTISEMLKDPESTKEKFEKWKTKTASQKS